MGLIYDVQIKYGLLFNLHSFVHTLTYLEDDDDEVVYVFQVGLLQKLSNAKISKKRSGLQSEHQNKMISNM